MPSCNLKSTYWVLYMSSRLTIAVVYGMLSIKLEAKADTHRIRTIATANLDDSPSTLEIISLTMSPILSIRPSSFRAFENNHKDHTKSTKYI